MNAHLLTEALKLRPEDRLQLIEALWETLSEEEISVTPEERARLADLDANPGDQSPWPEVKARPQQQPR
jgi:putative addiction module component (TIGR02574 family)